MRVFLWLVFAMASSGCAVKWGFRDRTVPGGYKQVAIPVFRNKTLQVGLETEFTNALVSRFERSQVAHVTGKDVAPVRIEGTIEKVDVNQGPGLQGGQANTALPTDTVLTTEYVLIVRTKILVRRQSDDKVIWEGTFLDQKNYQAPRIGEPVVNSANATYNESARRYTLASLADEMMSEAHDRITENF